jgi:ribosome-associated protein
MEGMTEGRWVLLDFGDVIIHILQEKERDYYKLEQFWNHALVVDEDEWSDDNLEEGKPKVRENKAE